MQMASQQGAASRELVIENAVCQVSLLRKRTACLMVHVVEGSLAVQEIAVYQAPMALEMRGDRIHPDSEVRGGRSLVALDCSKMVAVEVSPYG